MSKIHKGKPAWNKGKKGVFSEESRKQMSESQKNRDPNTFHHKITPDQNARIIEMYKNREVEFEDVGKIRKNGHPITYFSAFCDYAAKLYGVTPQAIYNRIKKYA
jgi:hypothetical protein